MAKTRQSASAFRLRQPRLATQPSNFAVIVPRPELPGVHYLLPFVKQESAAEPALVLQRGCLGEQPAHLLGRDVPDGSKLRLVQAHTERIQRVDLDSLRHARLRADQPAQLRFE